MVKKRIKFIYSDHKADVLCEKVKVINREHRWSDISYVSFNTPLMLECLLREPHTEEELYALDLDVIAAAYSNLVEPFGIAPEAGEHFCNQYGSFELIATALWTEIRAMSHIESGELFLVGRGSIES